jgi:ferritin-like metal-binding protein YciE
MAKAAEAEELKKAFQKHETETEGHVERLEEVFGELEETPRGTAVSSQSAISARRA